MRHLNKFNTLQTIGISAKFHNNQFITNQQAV